MHSSQLNWCSWRNRVSATRVYPRIENVIFHDLGERHKDEFGWHVDWQVVPVVSEPVG
jgi:hypothetical protein